MSSLTPFRYPGAKVKLLPPIMERCNLLGLKEAKSFTDVFAGGGSVFLHVAELYPEKKIIINDMDEWVYSFWKVVTSDKVNSLLDIIDYTKINITTFKELKKIIPTSMLDKAFYALFFNRTTFSGMLEAGPIGGLNQTGNWKVDCRFPKKNIIEKILKINKLLKDRSEVYNLSYTELLNNKDLDFIYLDPPYYHKGNALYRIPMTPEQHKELSIILQNNIDKPWVLSYDYCDEIKELYKDSNVEDIFVRYCFKGYTKKEDKKEYLISRGII